MDEILDLENSILSVASITSEVADSSLHSHSEADSHSEDVTLADNLDGNLDPSASAPTSVTSTTIQMSSSPPQRSRTTPKQKLLTGKDRYEFEIEKGKPRVVKPTAPVSPANEGKGIRGRKKVHSHIPVVSKPATAVKTITIATPPPPLQRQGTFTKDDTPTAPSGIPVLAKKGSPAKTVKKKQGTPHNITNNTQTGTTPAVRKLAGRGRAGSLPRTETSKKPAAGVRNSVSNQSLKSEALGSNSSLNANPTASAPRWNSNSNLNSAKKDATSKIASLWKKVEDTKRKETGTKDSRVWIAPNGSTFQTGCLKIIYIKLQ
ncbi:uncharacterized protein LOC142330756 [Lycorma delicatula]|uniref:uncharacterized protein LOC142330756 n=1 Tax=Lycorma delicatula TaxID=130591 RepID=UPI003F5185B1